MAVPSRPRPGRRTSPALALVVVLAVAAAACSGGDPDSGDVGYGAGVGHRPAPREPVPTLAVSTVSTRPDMVTGGDVLLEVRVPAGLDPHTVELRAGTTVLPDVLTAVPEEGPAAPSGTTTLRGLVTGLPLGPTTLTATAEGADGRSPARAALQVEVHPSTGPLAGGPLLPLFGCATAAAGLGPAGPECSAPTRVDWRSVATGGTVHDLADPTAPPPGTATVRTTAGEVPMVLRRERGVLHRAVYEVTTLVGDATAPRWSQGAAWNGRLVVHLAGSCRAGYGQGLPAATDLARLLADGYAVASTSAAGPGGSCNDVEAAMAIATVVEHVAEQLGPPQLTLALAEGEAGAAGHLALQDHPGLFDGMVGIDAAPDLLTEVAAAVDCDVLARFWSSAAGAAFTAEQRTAVEGGPGGCGGTAPLDLVRPSDGCDPAVPPGAVYEAGTRAQGLRCDLFATSVHQLGRDPADGLPRRPLDTTGVPYGLVALQQGRIDLERFIALNQGTGGMDADGRPVASRTLATDEALAVAYGNGRVSSGGGDQRVVPIIEVVRPGSTRRAAALRERLRLPDGVAAPNHRLWLTPGDRLLRGPSGREPFGADATSVAVESLDRWATAALADSSGNRAEQVARSRPPSASDRCWLADGTSVVVDDVLATPGPCADAFPVPAAPRQLAGGPAGGDVLACSLSPVDPATFGRELTPAQGMRLFAAFPGGLCDWSQPGRGRVPLLGAWLDYTAGPPVDPARALELASERDQPGP